MSDDFNKDTSIEDEIAKSLQKMAEEETTVAKALVGSQNDSVTSKKVNDIEYGKTQVVPIISEELLRKGQPADDDLIDDDIEESEEKTFSDEKNSTDSKDVPVKNKMPKKTKVIIGVVIGAVVVIAIIIAIVIGNSSKKNKQTYDYYYSQGMKLYEEGNYGDAADMLDKAAKDTKGKKNLDLKYTLFKCYENTGNVDESISILKDILSYDENYENAVKSLAQIYYKKEDGENLTKLIRKYEDSSCSNAIKAYVVNKPVPSKEAGSYDDNIELKFTSDTGAFVYYTTDGSEPTKKSTLYDGSAIEIQNGTTKIKAVAIDSIGVSSDIAEFEYVIEYGVPSAPDVSPASGQYSSGEKITINNVPDKCKAYYTLDGTTPTETSTEYTGEFEMPSGNTVVSFVIINEHGQSSTVVKRNYNVTAKSTYTYNQAESQLKNVLISKKILKSESTASDGSSVNFVYQTRTKIGDNEMYIIRYDVIKSGNTSTAGLYGVDTSSGKVYTVTGSEGSYSAKEY